MTHTKMTGTVKMKIFWLKYCPISISSLLRKELQHPPRERFVLSCVAIHTFILQFRILLSALFFFQVFRWLQLRKDMEYVKVYIIYVYNLTII